MKGTSAQIDKKVSLGQRSTAHEWAEKVFWMFAGFLVSGGTVFGEYAPFGASIVAAAPKKAMIWAVIGTCLGYMVLNPAGSFRSIATVLAIAAICWTFSDIKKIRKAEWFAPLVAFVPMLVTGLILAAIAGFSSRLVAASVIEAFLTAMGAYFIKKTVQISLGNKIVTKLDQQELACVILTGCILLLSFSRISFAGISFGRIIAIIAILIASKYGGVVGGSVSGVSTGVIFSLASSEVSFIAGGYAFGGLVAGLFSPMGRTATVISFFMCNMIIALQTKDTERIVACVYEMLIASGIFYIFPKELGNRVAVLFSSSSDRAKAEGLRKNIIMRLDFASAALKDVSNSVDGVAGKMSNLFTSNVSSIYTKSAKSVCTSCGMRSFCWENQEETTIEDFHRLSDPLQKNGQITEEDFSGRFQKRCCKSREMASEINKNYDGYMSYLAADRRVGEVRAVVAGQFSGLSDILHEMSAEFEHYEKFDNLAADRVASAMKKLGFSPLEVSCRVDVLGRMSVEIETDERDRNNLKRVQIIREVSRACGRRLAAPCISYVPNRCKLQFNEKTYYETEIASAQHISGNGQFCGDSYNYFSDGFGRMIVLISDGMGTGGRAAVDSNMAQGIMTKLCKAGLGFDSSLKVVNSALMVKSEDESLATLDIAAIDLHTGRVEIMKAGAPLTFIKKNDKVYRYDATSLPAGILTDVSLTHDDIWLRDGDWIVMLSDGAISTGDSWLESLLEDWEDKGAKELSQKIISEAKDRREEGFDDDITVIAIQMHSKKTEE